MIVLENFLGYILLLFLVFFCYKVSKKSKKILTKEPEIEIDEQFQEALELIENSAESILLTGRAGTGKSTLLTQFRKTTNKKVAVVAFTGVAALNVKGQTIHSFFKFGIGTTPDSISTVQDQGVYKNLDILIIDEISMVRADLLDCVDKFLRKNGRNSELPFGGIKVVFIGDLFQLPPVVTNVDKALFEGRPYEGPYFFNSKVFQKGLNLRHFELTKIRRQHPQDEERFITFLNAIRERNHTKEHLEIINERYDSGFDEYSDTGYLILVPTNEMSANYNRVRLSQLQSRPYAFLSTKKGNWDDGNGSEKFPTDENLILKVGAQIMLLNNDPEGRWANGDVGKIIKISEEDQIITVNLVNGKKIFVNTYTWERIEFVYNTETDKIESNTIASFTQFPLKLAWSSTIHKAQGKTFDKVVINFGRGTFAHGQAYVAFSRSRTMAGIILKSMVKDSDIRVDKRVLDFMNKYRISD